ncbi:class I SAM-dependent methyltransferase [Rikenella microfusus]|uniref:O-Methyltransferase involved in polyketide biosynthesis n=1 Tax=Rikenella microfusus TaxID=28139 RepID=A0A379MS05_9BACT|nr:class I SAM-dependent methyltransferase [Rikenella microfusus]SUE34514.1 O-Methyltransferase involved in polyketide biosynthesis [Rikenella microfusus]
MKKKYTFENIVAETLLIPLYMRAKESGRKDAILRDPEAGRLVERIDYDFSRLDGAKLSAVGCVVRGRYFDDAVRRFIAERRRPVVVNVGCGLDTRYQRIAERGNALFVEMDLPEVIDLRRELLPEPDADRYLAGSLLDTGWMDDLREQYPDGEFIFVIEGVLMYFREEQVWQLLGRLADRFGGGEVWFDVCGPMLARSKHLKPDSLRGHEARIRSGIGDGHDIERREPRLTLIEQGIYQRFFPRRWGIGGRLLGLLPGLSKQFSSMLGYRIRE